ncbi:glycerate kinase [Fulvivirga sedimenti]|uniref:Glycerate kinase n=1 Tax=Fulvivirga sedimenti TaxID=2879465 RepID=A0A9X1L065_9BACT|nr:glycerate kinase [Fulvivirga sedimenti]MCA6079160.1 glycerate kinase [Fulvivirga sedimenti]
MNVLFVPAQFKETIAATDAARLMAQAGRSHGWVCREQAISDGGEGFLDVFLSVGGELRKARVFNPVGKLIEADYVICNDTAIIEMARASGLELVPPAERDVLQSSTYGTGQLIHNALQEDVSTVIVSLGGSATNDGGMGMLRAMGAEFRDDNGNLIESFQQACRITTINLDKITYLIDGKSIIGATDVNNPLLGEFGATRIFGRQKGVNSSLQDSFEQWMECFARATQNAIGVDHSGVKGSGAAGGTGFALCACLNAQLTSGFDILSELVNLDAMVSWADLVVTGEGRMDHQTQYGKAPARICQLARKRGKKVAAIVGSYEAVPGKSQEFDAIYSLSALAGSSHAAMLKPRFWLEHAMNELIRDFSES